MRTKIILSSLMILILTMSFVAAEFSAQKGYDWLSAQGDATQGFDNNVYATSWSVMALDAAGYDTDTYVDWLYAKMAAEDFCFPSTSCTTKDTSGAVLALNQLQDDAYFDLIDAWYSSALQGASFSGDWMLEIATSSSGTCTIEYEINDLSQEVELEVSAGTFPSCGGSTFLNLDSCLQTNLITNNPGLLLGVDCSSLEGDVIMTLLYRSASTYYLLANENANVAEFEVTNGCFATSASGSCSKESSLYATWALDKIGSDESALIYLKENYEASSALDNSIMYFITLDNTYLDTLEDYQKTDGSFDRDVFRTSLAVLALSEFPADYSDTIEDAKSWLREQQGEDGDWGSIEETAITLFAAFSDESVEAGTCDDGIQNGAETGVDCGGACASCDGENECVFDTDCEDLYGDGYECFGGECVYYGIGAGCIVDEDCDIGELCIDDECIESECNFDGECDYPSLNENSNNCDDCRCGDGVYDDFEEFYNSCSIDSPDEEETECTFDDDCLSGYECSGGDCVRESGESGGSGIWGWIIFIVILLALGAGGYFAYKKGYLDALIMKIKSKFGKKPQGGSPGYTPPYQARPQPRMRRPGAPPRQGPPLQRSIQQARQQKFKR